MVEGLFSESQPNAEVSFRGVPRSIQRASSVVLRGLQDEGLSRGNPSAQMITFSERWPSREQEPATMQVASQTSLIQQCQRYRGGDQPLAQTAGQRLGSRDNLKIVAPRPEVRKPLSFHPAHTQGTDQPNSQGEPWVDGGPQPTGVRLPYTK